jgi:hypothetical protein
MTLANNTPYAAAAVPYVAPEGQHIVLALVKGSFVRGRGDRFVPAEKQSPIRCNDVVHFPEARESSIKYPSDVGTEKLGTDVVVVGDAIAVKAVRYVDTVVQVRKQQALLRVHGSRIFFRSATGLAVSSAASFERKPIVYEEAYGGTSEDFSVVERRNPVGRGVAARQADLVDRPAPSIEHPARPFRVGTATEPVGYGAIGTSWLPRAEFVGTCDGAWMRDRMPLLPLDFDRRYNNVAHPGLQLDPHLAPGEAIAIGGMTIEGAWRAELPALRVVVRGKRDDGARLEARPPVDLVLVEPEADRIELTLRFAMPRGRGRTVLREVQIDEERTP